MAAVVQLTDAVVTNRRFKNSLNHTLTTTMLYLLNAAGVPFFVLRDFYLTW